MAYAVSFHCHECKQDRTAYIASGRPIPTVCHECAETVKQTEKAEWLTQQRMKHAEERLAEIEEFMWDYRNDNSMPLWSDPFGPII